MIEEAESHTFVNTKLDQKKESSDSTKQLEEIKSIEIEKMPSQLSSKILK